MIQITNERGEPVDFPPGGLTINELLASFGNARINILPDAVSADSQADTGDTTDELNGLIAEPDVQVYPLIVKAASGTNVKSIAARLAAGTASIRLIVAGVVSDVLEADTSLKTLAILLPLAAGESISLEVTAQTGADDLGFTIAFGA